MNETEMQARWNEYAEARKLRQKAEKAFLNSKNAERRAYQKWKVLDTAWTGAPTGNDQPDVTGD